MMAELVLYNNMKAAIEKCQSVDEIRDIRDKAEALRQYSKVAGDSEAMNKCAAIKIRAERRAGELLKEMPKLHGARPSDTESHAGTPLADLGVTKNDSSRWQRLADIPEDRFEEHIETALEKRTELTTADTLRLASTLRRDGERKSAAENGKDKNTESATFFVCDFDKADIDDASVDVIITDPPYPREFIPEYGKLSRFAARVLKPDSSLIVMVGESYLPDIIAELGKAMTYYWCCSYLTPGQKANLRQKQVQCGWKPLLWYTNGRPSIQQVFDVFTSPANDKAFHEWGQSVGGMEEIVERFSLEGQTVLDPFCGAGTTGVAAVKLGRRFIGIDLDESAIDIAKGRIA